MKSILVVAPHPDDETLGCGGTILRHVAEGDSVHWLIMTDMRVESGFPEARIHKRSKEIDQVASFYGMTAVHRAGFPTTELDSLPRNQLVSVVSEFMMQVQPDTIYVPYRNDVHSDHAVVFDAVAACSKSFRYPFLHSVYAYETLSETEFGIRPNDPGFRPNLFVEITPYLEKKLEIMRLYSGEMHDFPFPRSEIAIRAQSALRGSQSGVVAAEAYMILKEVRFL